MVTRTGLRRTTTALAPAVYTTNLPPADVTEGKAWVAVTYVGAPLAPEHGGPRGSSCRTCTSGRVPNASGRWVHVRQHHSGFTTIPEHMPHAHRAHLEWSPWRLIRWGASVGPQTAALVEQIFASRPHPEQGYRSCVGLLQLVKQYGPERVEGAGGRAVTAGAR